MGWFQGKGVLVTGGASGIGAAASQRFAREGAGVCVADLNLEGAERIAGLIRQAGGKAIACKSDISRQEDNLRMVTETVTAFGGLDVAFLNAGLQMYQSFADLDLATFDRLIGVNLRGTFMGLKAVHDAIRPGGGVVVTSSGAGLIGLAESAAYSASKHGLLGLVKSAATGFAKKGARVNAICPGGVNTPMNNLPQHDQIVDPDALPMAPFRGFVDSQHVAELVLFLTSPRAGGITGTVVPIDSGSQSSFPPFEV